MDYFNLGTRTCGDMSMCFTARRLLSSGQVTSQHGG